MKTLRSYQEEYLELSLDPNIGDGWSVFVAGTGGGKSLLLPQVVRQAQDRGLMTGGLVLVPQINLEESLSRPQPVLYRGAVVGAPQWQRLRKVRGVTGANLRLDQVYLTTHARAAVLFKGLLARNPMLGDHYWVHADEIGHSGAGATILSDILTWCGTRGARIRGYTATDFRHDRAVVVPTGAHVYRVPLVQLQRDGVAPQNITLRMHDMPGVEAPTQTADVSDTLVAAEVERLLADKRPTLCVVPPRPRSFGGALALAKRIAAGLKAGGVAPSEILIDIGPKEGVEDPEGGAAEEAVEGVRVARITDRLEAENAAPVGGLRFLIVCQRGREGANWIRCARYAHCVGVPESVPAATQSTGRTTRNKDGLPENAAAVDLPDAAKPYPWVNDVVVEFMQFRPPEDAHDAKVRHAMMLCELALALNSSEVTYDYLRYWTELRLSPKLPPTGRVLAAQHDPATVPTDRRIYWRWLVAALIHAATRIDGYPLYGRIYRLVRLWRLSRFDAFGVFEELILHAGCINPDLLARLRELLLLALGDGPPEAFHDRLWDAYRQVGEEFATLVVPTQLFRGLESTLTPDLMDRICTTMLARRNAVHDLDWEQVIELLQSYAEAHKRPLAIDGPATEPLGYYVGLPDFNVHQLNQLLQRKWKLALKTLLTIYNLTGWITGVKGRPMLKGSTLVADWGSKILRRPDGSPILRPVPDLFKHLASPQAVLRASGDPAHRVAGLPGECRVGMEAACWFGWRGLPPGSTVAGLLA